MKWKTIAKCPPKTVESWDTLEEAEAAIRQIDYNGCGHTCMVDGGRPDGRRVPWTERRKWHYIIPPEKDL